jgi:predicted nucleotidyltransferase
VLKLNKFDLVSYASSFVSFVLKSGELDKSHLEDIILFGSVARGDFGSKSDIDLFVNTENEKIENILNKLLAKFYKSRVSRDYSLRGGSNKIRLSVGTLDKWRLKRSIISDGIVLYGGYKEVPKNLEHFCFFTFEPIKNVTKRNRIIRKLFGRKEAKTSGLLEKLNMKQISERSFLVPSRNSSVIMELFKKEKVDYRIFEIWSDSF